MIRIGFLLMMLAAQKDDFLSAIKARDVVVVERMLAQDASLANARGEDGLNAVQRALFHIVGGEAFLPASKNEVLKVVLAAKPKLDIFDAAGVGTADDVRRLLREDPERARARSIYGWTPLHVAAFAGNLEATKVLLDAGADVHARAKSRFKNTPLQVALLTGEYGTAKLLLDRGADPLVRQAKGFTPMHEAAFLGRIDLIELLLAHGAELDSCSDDGRTALSEAVRGKHEETAELLRKKGAKMGKVGETEEEEGAD